MRDRRSISRGILSGVVAGVAATIVMDQFFKLFNAGQKAIERRQMLSEGKSEWEIANEQSLKELQAEQQEDTTEIVAARVAEAIDKPFVSREEKKRAGRVVHYTFGTLMGVVYGIASEIFPEAATGGGTAFGTLLFLGADEIAVPALKLSRGPNENAVDHLEHWAAHVVYGGTLEMTRGLIRRLL